MKFVFKKPGTPPKRRHDNVTVADLRREREYCERQARAYRARREDPQYHPCPGCGQRVRTHTRGFGLCVACNFNGGLNEEGMCWCGDLYDEEEAKRYER